MRSLLHTFGSVGFCCAILSLTTGARRGGEPPTTQAVEEVRAALAAGPVDASTLLPGLADASPAKLREARTGRSVIGWANEQRGPIPLTTYTLYREFRRNGSRQGYQDPSIQKREQLSGAVMAVWLGGDEAAIDRVNDLVWNICEESNWVWPAHESVGEIDLWSAETAAGLGWVDALLRDRLPQEIRDRIRMEVRRRILDPYLDHGAAFGWNNGTNNWTGVCAGAVGQALLLLDPDVDRQAKGLALAVEQCRRFIDRAFEEDGASTEGIGYWNYGLSEFVIFAEMMRVRTGGAIDLLAGEKLRLIAKYPAAVALGRHAFASFSDSHEDGSVLPFLAAKLHERTGEASLLAQTSDRFAVGRLGWTLCNVLWHGDREAVPFAPADAVLPKAGVAKRVGRAGGKPLVLVAKAGHNAEQHNQNDVGSFVLRIGETTYLCDPGAGLYSAAYFGPKRYENIFANSYGHSVPRIGGQLQKPGPEYRGELAIGADGGVRISFPKAYGLKDLTALDREFRVGEDGVVTMEDRFAFSGEDREVEEAFVTWLDVAVDGRCAQIRAKEGTLEIRTAGGTFAAERLEEACKANQKKGVLTRVTVTYPAARTVTARFTMHYQPAR